MALSKSTPPFFSMPAVPSVLTMLALTVVLFWCSCKDDPAIGGEGEPALVCESALSDGASPSAYWAVDRVEEGAAAGEGIAVLENLGTLLTEERTVKELPEGVGEGWILTDGGVLRVDKEATAARSAGISERFERLKAGGGAGLSGNR